MNCDWQFYFQKPSQINRRIVCVNAKILIFIFLGKRNKWISLPFVSYIYYMLWDIVNDVICIYNYKKNSFYYAERLGDWPTPLFTTARAATV